MPGLLRGICDEPTILVLKPTDLAKGIASMKRTRFLIREFAFRILLLSFFALPCDSFAMDNGVAESEFAPPVELDVEQDHRRMMNLLGMESIRRGANGRDPNAPNAANYDESKANIYPSLPDPLLTQDRQRVDSAEMWWNVRRPEIVELFDREVYGRVPEELPAVRWEVVSTTEGTNGGVPIITKELVGRVDNSAYPPIEVNIEMYLTTPAQSTAPVPVILQFSGGFFYRPPFAEGSQEYQEFRRRFGRGPRGPDWRNLVLQRGWGYAAINTSSIQADNGGGLTKGIIGLANEGQPREPEDWGALRAWAWGASRALDYFESDDGVDAEKVGLEGHSRWGKAALVAMAYDPRFAVAYVSSSGAGGASLYRRNFGEIIENVAGSGEYHWMAGNFIKYAGPLTWDDLPVDAHELVALCAPRPVFISSGQDGDNWVDAKGMFLAAAYSQPVYELLGTKTMGTYDFPLVEVALIDGEIAFRQHSGGHTDGPNWPTFIEFASRYLKKVETGPIDN